MSFLMEESIEIERPIDQVFDWMQEHDEWRLPYVRSVRPLTDGPMRVGSRYENRIKAGGITAGRFFIGPHWNGRQNRLAAGP